MNDLRIDVTPPPLSGARRSELRSAAPLEISAGETAPTPPSTPPSRPRRSGTSPRRELYQRFWAPVLQDLRRATPDSHVPALAPRNWVPLPCGLGRTGYAIAFASDKRLRAELYVDAKTHDLQRGLWAHFVGSRMQIEARFGRPLVWEELPDRRASRIATYYPGDAEITNERDWPRYRSWAVDSYVRLRTAIEPLLHALVR